MCSARRGRKVRTFVLLILESCINNLNGTDGFRLLCHQFFPSCLSRRENCLKSSENHSSYYTASEASVWFPIIVTPLSSHRVSGLQAFEKPSERPGDDDGKSGDDGEKSYSQGQETRHMVSPLQNGRRCCNVCLRRKNLCATLQMTRASHRKRSGVLFMLLRTFVALAMSRDACALKQSAPRELLVRAPMPQRRYHHG